MDREYYIRLRERYRPEVLKVVFILESPPASGKYFYDETGLITEPLFKAFMELLKFEPKSKKDGLKYFSQTGHYLVDATYRPVNKLKNKERTEAIIADYELLVRDLRNIEAHEKTQLILIKANICRLLGPRLLKDGFNVVNNNLVIPFPSSGQQGKFRAMISKVYQVNNGYA